jgi:hypothetical protein
MVSKVMMLSPTAKFCTGCSSNILQAAAAAAGSGLVFDLVFDFDTMGSGIT